MCLQSPFSSPPLRLTVHPQCRGEANGAMNWGINRGRCLCDLNIWFNVAVKKVLSSAHPIWLCVATFTSAFSSALSPPFTLPWSWYHHWQQLLGTSSGSPHKHISNTDSQPASTSTSHLKTSSPNPNLDSPCCRLSLVILLLPCRRTESPLAHLTTVI